MLYNSSFTSTSIQGSMGMWAVEEFFVFFESFSTLDDEFQRKEPMKEDRLFGAFRLILIIRCRDSWLFKTLTSMVVEFDSTCSTISVSKT
jgi:hypothetical protein